MHRPLAFILGGICGVGLAAGAVAAEPARAPVQLAQAAAQQAPPKTKAAAPAADDSALKQRVEQLEEQLVDMQVVIGTLESLARSGGAPASPDGGGFSGGADSVRLDGMETQLRALSAQIQQLTDQVRALGGQPRRSDAGAMPAGPLPGTPSTDIAAGSAPAPTGNAAPDAGRFGSTTVTAGTGGDSIGGLIESDPAAAGGATPPAGAAPDAAGEGPAGTDMAALPPAFGAATAPNAADAGNAKQLYETAYGYLMQRDYSAAQGSFEDFLTRYPQELAGRQRPILAWRSALCAWRIQGRRRFLSQGLPELRRQRARRRQLVEARHVARPAGPEGRRVLLVRRAFDTVPQRA